MAAPTVALNTPADAATNVSRTPNLLFTGTDAESNEIEYTVHVDTVNTFDSLLGSELISNGGFETNSTGWTLDANYTRDNTDSKSGSWSVKQVSTTGYQNLYSSSGITVTANTDYVLTFWLKMTSASPTRLQVNRTSAFGTPFFDNALVDNAGVWTLVTKTFNTGIYTQIWIRFYNDNGTVTAFYDDFSLKAKLPIMNKLSVTSDATFTGTGDPHPWPSGNQVTYTVQAGDALSDNTTYYWRVIGIDPLGGNTYGAWSTTRSFTTLAASGGVRPTMLLMGI